MGQIKNIKLHIVTDIKESPSGFTLQKKRQNGKVYEIWKSCSGAGRKICGSKSNHRQELRRWHTGSTLRTRPRSRNRQISTKSDQTYGKEKGGKEIQDQAFHQSHQLQPSDAHPVQCRCCFEQIHRQQRCVEGRQQESSCSH